jgi:hypothetical protein
MDLSQFYDLVRVVIADLRTLGCAADADRVENALLGGTTSGEILGDLRLALSAAALAAPTLADELNRLALWASETWRGR